MMAVGRVKIVSCENCECNECVPTLEEFGSSVTFKDLGVVVPEPRRPEEYWKWARIKGELKSGIGTQLYEEHVPRSYGEKWINELAQGLFFYLFNIKCYSWDVAMDYVDDTIEYLAAEIQKAQQS